MVFFSPGFSNNGFNASVISLAVRDLKEMGKKIDVCSVNYC